MYETRTNFYDVAVVGKKVVEWDGRIPVTERGFPVMHGNEPRMSTFPSARLAHEYADKKIAQKTKAGYTLHPRFEPKKMTWLMKLRVRN